MNDEDNQGASFFLYNEMKTHMCTCAHAHTNTHTQAHAQTCMHTSTHAHEQAQHKQTHTSLTRYDKF